MATTGAGNPYVESSDLVANYPAVSETLAERLDVIGVNPFATASARSSAIPLPTEGMMSSLNDDDTVYRYNGTAWIAVTGGIQLITTQSFTTVASVNVNNCFTSTYDNYRIVIRWATSAADGLGMRLRSSGTDNTSSVYNEQNLLGNGTGTGSARTVNANTWSICSNTGLAQVAATVSLDIFEPALAAQTNFSTLNNKRVSAGAITEIVSGYHTNATAYDGFSVYIGTGTITGVLSVYGYRKG